MITQGTVEASLGHVCSLDHSCGVSASLVLSGFWCGESEKVACAMVQFGSSCFSLTSSLLGIERDGSCSVVRGAHNL